jgi:Domain of unknown function (DUF1844)
VADEIKDDKVRVVDRRWFTAEGELKDSGAPAAAPSPTAATPRAEPAPSPPAATPPTGSQTTPAAPSAAGKDEAPSEVGFLDLVDFLAQQAVALLSGQIPGRGRDPVMARFFIDLLGVVQEKTSGQLAPEETRYLEDVLFQLRSLFVAATR